MKQLDSNLGDTIEPISDVPGNSERLSSTDSFKKSILSSLSYLRHKYRLLLILILGTILQSSDLQSSELKSSSSEKGDKKSFRVLKIPPYLQFPEGNGLPHLLKPEIIQKMYSDGNRCYTNENTPVQLTNSINADIRAANDFTNQGGCSSEDFNKHLIAVSMDLHHNNRPTHECDPNFVKDVLKEVLHPERQNDIENLQTIFAGRILKHAAWHTDVNPADECLGKKKRSIFLDMGPASVLANDNFAVACDVRGMQTELRLTSMQKDFNKLIDAITNNANSFVVRTLGKQSTVIEGRDPLTGKEREIPSSLKENESDYYERKESLSGVIHNARKLLESGNRPSEVPSKDYKSAITSLKRAISSCSENPYIVIDAGLWLGVANTHLGNTEEAKTWLTKAKDTVDQLGLDVLDFSSDKGLSSDTLLRFYHFRTLQKIKHYLIYIETAQKYPESSKLLENAYKLAESAYQQYRRSSGKGKKNYPEAIYRQIIALAERSKRSCRDGNPFIIVEANNLIAFYQAVLGNLESSKTALDEINQATAGQLDNTAMLYLDNNLNQAERLHKYVTDALNSFAMLTQSGLKPAEARKTVLEGLRKKLEYEGIIRRNPMYQKVGK